MQQLFYSKNSTKFQNATVITNCDDFITKCDSYYKMRRLLQNATVHTFILYIQFFFPKTNLVQLRSFKIIPFFTLKILFMNSGFSLFIVLCISTHISQPIYTYFYLYLLFLINLHKILSNHCIKIEALFFEDFQVCSGI